MQHLHARGIVHMDVKPDNIYTTEQAGAYKLGDFGLATCRSSRPDVGLQEGDSRSALSDPPPCWRCSLVMHVGRTDLTSITNVVRGPRLTSSRVSEMTHGMMDQ